MYIKRLDNGCEARVMAINPQTGMVLIEARWTDKSGPNRNIVYVTPQYFEQKYGKKPHDLLLS